MTHHPRKVDEGRLREAATMLGAAFAGVALFGLLVGERAVSPVLVGAALGVASLEGLRRWVIRCSPEATREDLP